ncbi:MAG TPA: DUF6585 family protein [Pseudonocardia sp.]|nr:DUF6585 family protein [Pseudonocardia sp.]
MGSAEKDERRWSLAIVGVVVGLVLAGLGAWFVQPDSPPTFGPIECDGEVMGPGDECIVIRGAGEDFTYESEQASRQARLAAWRDEPGDEVVGWSLVGVGVVAGLAGSVAGARRRGRSLRDDPAQVPAVPPEVRAVASEHGLGEFSSTHRTEPGELWITLGGTVLFAVVTFALAVGPATGGGWAAVLVLLCGFAALACLAATVRRLLVARTMLYLFDHGLVHARGSSLAVFPWRDTEIRRSVAQQPNAPKPDFRYWLQRPGSRSVELSPVLGLDEFGPEMERRLTAERAPADIDEVAAGQRAWYGPFAVDLTGLTTPKGTITWTQVRAVEIKNGAVQVWQVDARRPQSVEVAKVANVFVFLALVETVREATRRG